MNSARSLYSILNVIIFLLLIGLGLGIFFFAMILLGVKQDIIHINEDISNFKTETMLYIFVILKLSIYVVFIVALWKLRKVTQLLLKKDFYNKELINVLSSSGKLMVITGVVSWCIDWLSNIFFKYKFIIGINEKTIVYLLAIAIGLFLMLISTVLRDAMTIKEENDLTI